MSDAIDAFVNAKATELARSLEEMIDVKIDHLLADKPNQKLHIARVEVCRESLVEALAKFFGT